MIWLDAVLGLRRGEVAVLRVGNVNLLRKALTITEQVTRGRGGAGDIGPPKSAVARRTISIPAQLADELSAHVKALQLTGADPEELLFPNAAGKPLDYSIWHSTVWEPAVKAVGLDGLNFNTSAGRTHRDGRRGRRRQDSTGETGTLGSEACPGQLCAGNN